MIKDIKELNFPAYATLETATATIADMGDRTITSQVKIDGDVVPDFSYDWEVEFKGERYIHPVRTPQGTKDTSSHRAKIDLVFQHWAIYEMKRQYFVEMASTSAGTAIADKYIASLGLNLGDFVTAFNLVLNHYFDGRIIIRLNPEWQYDTEAKFVSISYSYIWDVLQQMHEIYGVRWTLKTNADGVCEILVGYPAEEVSHIFEYGFEGGLLSVQRQVQSTEIRNRLLGRGGSKNLPHRYFKDKDPNNPLFEADPDWIPELANITFTELRGKTFRDYVRGWKAKRYGGTPMAEPTEAYLIGYNADKFDPIEYVDDKESIEKYGVLVGALENNEEIYPSIQGAPGDVDMIVDAEQVTDDDVDAAIENDAVETNVDGMSYTKTGVKTGEEVSINVSARNAKVYFSIPEGKKGTINEPSYTAKGKYQNYSPSTGRGGGYVDVPDGLITVYRDKCSFTVHKKSTGEQVSRLNIPPGEYYYEAMVVASHAHTGDINLTASVSAIHLIISTDTDSGWHQTFDIWVRNIWGSERNAGETDQQYADRVWLPILGDRMGDEARVVFASGWLSFSSDWEFPIVGYAFDDSKTGSHWRLTLAKIDAEKDAGRPFIPYEGYNAYAGDRFFFIGIDMSHQYVLWGEERIDDYKRDTLPETARINPSWVIKTDKVRLNQNREGAKLIDSLSVGAQIRLASKQFISGVYESLYVQSMTYNWTADTILYPDVEVVVSDKVHTVKNPVAQIQGNIETLQRQMGSLSNIQQIIRQVCDQIYLRKDGVEDLSKSPTRFLGKVTGEKFRQGQIGGRDWGIYRDENGNAILEADKIVARQGILVSDLVVNEATYVGGLQINSAASMKVTAVEETEDGYICYFDQQQGSVTNKFKVDDIALCQKFDSEDNEIKFYKRRVIAIADASVTLSKTDVNGEGVPSVDDEIIHYGNYTDGTRQFVIIRDVIGGGYERMLMGLDSVNSDGVEYYFAGKSADSKARWFVGDDEQYAKYEDGQFTIKGNLFVTGSDKPISYITEALGDGAGGLILGTAIIVGYNDDEGTFVPMAGMSGVFDESRDDGGAAAWYGGVLGNAKIVFNMDGSGYLADGNISWDKDGAVTFSDKIKISTEGDETLGSILTMLAVFNDMFHWEEEGVTIRTDYNFFSKGQNAAGGIGEEEGGSGVGGGIIDEEMSDDSDNAVANRVIKSYIDALFSAFKENPKAYVPLKTINGMEIYGEGNIAIEGGSGEGTSGLTAINVNSQSFQPDSNGIVTLPDYRPLEYYNQDLAKKVDKVDGKGLSTNDYTTAEKNKLAGIAAGAEVNVQSDWNATSGDAFIKNKPTLSVVATSGQYTDLTGTPKLAVVATSGSYEDLSNKPTIPVEVTETTVAGWGFTKNTGTYIKPTTGIPKSHLASGVQTSLGLADTALQEGDLDDYPTKTEVGAALTEALKNYALAQDLTQVDERLADVEGKATNNATAITNIQKLFTDGKANKAIADGNGNNIVNTYATKTALATTNTNVTANADAISTLQGYFTTSGVANNADKLDGHDSSYFATVANLNNLETKVTTAEGEIDDLQEDNATFMAWYNAVGQYFKYDSVNEAWYLDGDFYTTGQNAAGDVGEEEGSTGGGLDEDQLEEYLTANGYLNSIPSEYVTETELSAKGYATTSALSAYALKSSLGTFASKNSLAFSELTSKPTTLSGYGITDGVRVETGFASTTTGAPTIIGYSGTGEGWFVSGPAMRWGITNYYTRLNINIFEPSDPTLCISNVYGGEEYDWATVLTSINVGRYAMIVDSGIRSGADLNELLIPGAYNTWNNTTNAPSNNATILVIGSKTNYFTSQIFTNDQGHLFSRMYEGGTWRDWRTILDDNNYTSYVYSKTESDGRYFPLTGNKTITGSVRIESGLIVTGTLAVNNHTDINSSMAVDAWLSVDGEIKGKAISNPTNANVTNQWQIIRAGNALYLQVGTDAGDTAGTFHLTGYTGVAASHIRLHTAKATITGNIDVAGTSLLRGAVTANSGMTIQNGITVLNGVSSFVGHTTFSDGITVDGEQAILGPIPSGGTYPRFRVFPHTSGFYFQAATYDGTSREGIVQFSGMQGVNAAEVYFRSNSTMFTGSLKVDGQVGTFSQIIGLHSTGAYHRYRINQNSVGTFFQAGVNDGSKLQGTMYLSGIDNTMMTALHLRADATTVYGSMSIPNAPLTLGSTLSVSGATTLNSSLTVSGQATLSGGAFLPPSKTILFQDAATETFTISFNSEVGGLNLSGATRTLGLASFQKGIQIEHGQSIAFVDSNGVKQYITLDEANGAIKVIGNFFATGQNAAGDAGEEYPGMVTSWEDAPDDLTGYTVSAGLVKELRDKVENGGAANVEIKVNALGAYDGRTITTTAMQTLTGLSVDIAQKMLQGAYNKVIDNSEDYPEVWDYTARGTSTGIIIYLRIGDGYDTNTAYALTYTQSAANWSIIMGEI